MDYKLLINKVDNIKSKELASFPFVVGNGNTYYLASTYNGDILVTDLEHGNSTLISENDLLHDINMKMFKIMKSEITII